MIGKHLPGNLSQKLPFARLVVFAGVVFAGMVALPQAVSADGAKVLVRNAQGSTSIIRQGQPLEAEKDMLLQAGDVIRTGPSAQTDIVWNNKWGYRLLGQSECILSSSAKKDSKITMIRGDIIVNIRELPKEGQFRVATPTAVIAVRGTQFWGRVLPGAEQTTFAVRKGTVDLTVLAINQTFQLSAGQAMDIRKGDREVAVRLALEAEMRAMSQADDIAISAA